MLFKLHGVERIFTSWGIYGEHKLVKRIKVYISFAMQFADGNMGWKKELKDSCDFADFWDPEIETDHEIEAKITALKHADNPMLKISPLYREMLNGIVTKDLNAVKSCDALVVRWSAGVLKGAGAKSEMSIAAHYNIPVIAIITLDEMYKLDIPLWCVGCITHFAIDAKEAAKKLLEIQERLTI